MERKMKHDSSAPDWKLNHLLFTFVSHYVSSIGKFEIFDTITNTNLNVLTFPLGFKFSLARNYQIHSAH